MDVPRIMRGIFAALAWAGLVGCTYETVETYHYSRRIHVRAETSYSEDERAALVSAAKEWSEKSGRFLFRVSFDLEPGREYSPVAGVVYVQPFPLKECGANQSGTTIQTHCPLTFELAAHELGHVMGLGHWDAGIMQPIPASATKLSARDIERCQEATVCDPLP